MFPPSLFFSVRVSPKLKSFLLLFVCCTLFQSLAAAEVKSAPQRLWDTGYPAIVHHLIFKKTPLEKDWSHKAAITIDASAIDAGLSNFPVLVDHSVLPQAMLDADGTQSAKANGGDIRFSLKEDGSDPIACEIVSINLDNDPVSSTAEIWVHLPVVSATNDTSLYVWWGNPSENQPAATDPLGSQAVWSHGYAAVYHMEGNYSGVTDEVFDSSPNSNHGTARISNITDSVNGKIGGAQQWAQAGDALIVPHDASLVGMSELTISLWVFRNGNGLSNRWGRYIWKNDGYTLNGYNSDGSEVTLNSHHVGIFSSADLPEFNNFNGFWFYVANTWDGNTETNDLYVVPSNTTSLQIHTFSSDLSSRGIGQTIGGNEILTIGNLEYFSRCSTSFCRTLNGTIDELRIQSIARSIGWVKAEYNNIHHTDTFFKPTGPVLPGS